MKCQTKIVVFDLDETLGYFLELGMFWDATKYYFKTKHIDIQHNQQLFNQFLNLYPEFLRPNIIDILNYIKKKKLHRHCDKLMIYTNNQGPLEWAKYIIQYFEDNVNYKIFDQIIAAFKIGGKQVELCRTTNLKTHNDLIRCTKLPINTQFCFLDDVFYPDMNNDNVYYINVKPYTHDLDFNIMIERFFTLNLIEPTNKNECKQILLEFLNSYNYIFVEKSKEAQNIDIIVSKKILEHLHIFFRIKPKTKKNRIKSKKHTLKNI